MSVCVSKFEPSPLFLSYRPLSTDASFLQKVVHNPYFNYFPPRATGELAVKVILNPTRMDRRIFALAGCIVRKGIYSRFIVTVHKGRGV